LNATCINEAGVWFKWLRTFLLNISYQLKLAYWYYYQIIGIAIIVYLTSFKKTFGVTILKSNSEIVFVLRICSENLLQVNFTLDGSNPFAGERSGLSANFL
jgi:hypothetical protein